MHRFELDLFLGYTHQIADSGFSVFSPIGLNIEHLVGEDFAIESVEERHKEILLALKPNVVISEIEAPSPSASLCEHEEIISICNKS